MADSHLPYCVWRHLTSCVGVLSREVWGWLVGGVRCVAVCAQRCFVSVDIPENRTLLRSRVLKRPRRLRLHQRDAVLWLATLHSGLRRLGAAPMVQHCDRSELKGTHLGVFQQRYLVHQLILATPAAAPTDQPILSQADWCAVRAVARCELGLVPVFYTGEGVRVCSGEVAVE